MNVRDSEVIGGILKKEGYQLIDSLDNANVIIFNTCSVRQHAEDKVWSEVGRISKLVSRTRAKPIIGIVGCMAQNYKDEIFERSPVVDFVVGPSDIHKIPDIIQSLSAKRYPLNAIVLIGAKSKDHLVCIDEFKKLGCKVQIATDDGSLGFKGRVTELTENLLSTIEYRLSAIYACGPKPMLQKISTLSKDYNLPAQISLEEHMSCGIGACLGCVVDTIDGYKRVCKEGPVFNAQEIIW